MAINSTEENQDLVVYNPRPLDEQRLSYVMGLLAPHITFLRINSVIGHLRLVINFLLQAFISIYVIFTTKEIINAS